jgi:integration host factor subunit beta
MNRGLTWKQLVEIARTNLELPFRWTHLNPPAKQTKASLEVVFGTIAEQVLHGKTINIPGFGVFSRRTRKARRILNPHTHQLMDVPESTYVGFRCSKSIRR